MNSGIKKPVFLVAFGLFVMTVAGFFTLAHVGMMSRRQAGGIVSGFGYRGQPGPAADAGYVADFKRGVDVVESKAAGYFSWFDDAPQSAPGATAAADGGYGGGEEGSGGGESDPFEDFYRKNYGKGSPSSSAGDGAWGDYGGGSGGSWSGSGETMTAGGRPSASQSAPGSGSEGGGEAPASSGAAPAAAGGQGQPKAGGSSAAQQLQASLPDKFRAPPFPGEAAPRSGGAGPAPALKGGSLSGLPGQRGSADLNSAEEQARAGLENSYKSKMSLNAAGVAGGSAGGPAAVKAPGAPQAVSGGSSGGSAGGGSSSGGSSSASASGDKKDSAAGGTASSGSGSGSPSPARKSASDTARTTTASASSNSSDFLNIVAKERLNREEQDYITDEDAAGVPEQAQLKPGAIVAPENPPTTEKSFFGLVETEIKPDPAAFADLTSSRKKELKRQVHGFLKRVENKYGEMSDIYYTSCAKEKELCEKHGLTEGFLTMRTSGGANLTMGLKYAKDKWQPYTVSFKRPVHLDPPKPEEPAQEPAPPAGEGEDGDWGQEIEDPFNQVGEDGLIWV